MFRIDRVTVQPVWESRGVSVPLGDLHVPLVEGSTLFDLIDWLEWAGLLAGAAAADARMSIARHAAGISPPPRES